MVGGLISIVGGILAASGFIIAKKPNAKELIDKLVPYQGWVGVVMLGWGVWELIGSITGMALLSTFPIYWTFWLLTAISDLGVGMILGFGMVSKWTMSGNPAALEKGQALRAKLVKFQVPLGFLAIIMGFLYILFSLGILAL
jgi:hypothetical protein